MIPINEIRINNWFNLEFIGPFQWEYQHFEEYVTDKAHGCNVDGVIISDKIEPIALTPDILGKCGFTLDKFSSGKERVYEFNDGGRHYRIVMTPNTAYGAVFYRYEEAGWLYKPNVVEANYHAYLNKCIYVHQLQNIISALTGEELNIEL